MDNDIEDNALRDQLQVLRDSIERFRVAVFFENALNFGNAQRRAEPNALRSNVDLRVLSNVTTKGSGPWG